MVWTIIAWVIVVGTVIFIGFAIHDAFFGPELTEEEKRIRDRGHY